MKRYLAEKSFAKEAPHIKKLFSQSGATQGGMTSWKVFFEEKVPYIQINNFPLPDSYLPKDYEDIVISLANYPDSPPNGIYIHGDSKSNIRKINEAIGKHVYDTTYYAQDKYEQLEKIGWKWVCFHMGNSSWKYNFDNPIKGDCLYSYLLLLFAALNGNYTK